MGDLRERILEAHGGEARWRAVARIGARVSLGGSLFVAHMQPSPLRDTDMAVEPRRFRITLSPFGAEGGIGIFEPRRVWIEDAEGRLLGDRGTPGVVTRSLRHWMVWDRLDLLFVLGVSLWQALLLPQLLCRSGVAAEPAATQPSVASQPRTDMLDVRLPSDLPVPASQQRLYADATGCLTRADYAPVAWGRALRVAQLLEAPEAVEGLRFATRQSVHPCWLGRQPWRGTRLVWLTLDDVAVAMRAA